MSSFKNRVQLIGNVGHDLELKTFEKTSLLNLRVATNEKYKNKEGVIVDTTEWHNVAVWGPLAVLCSKHLSKGSQVVIDGKLKTRSYEDKEGVKHYVTEIIASDVVFNLVKAEAESPF